MSNSTMANFINKKEAQIIDTFRPYINSTIININNELQSEFKDLSERTDSGVGIFVAGGDAIRRYKNNVSVTKDIDTKIYIPNNEFSNKENIDRITKIVINNLLKLVSFFI